MTSTALFMIEKTDRCRLHLRRYSSVKCPTSSERLKYHTAMVAIDEGPSGTISGDTHPHEDPRWPSQCFCGYVFPVTDPWQLYAQTLYRRIDTGEEMILRDAPVGACWDATWLKEGRVYPQWYIDADGRCLTIRTPAGDWCPSERAMTCDRPSDYPHRCWKMEGQLEAGTLSVYRHRRMCGGQHEEIALGSWRGYIHHSHIVTVSV